MLKTPGSVWLAFWSGFGSVAVLAPAALGLKLLPLALTIDRPGIGVLVLLALMLVASVLGGGVAAVPVWLYGWAYRRTIEAPGDPWRRTPRWFR